MPTHAVSEASATEFLANLNVGTVGAIILLLTLLRLFSLHFRPKVQRGGLAQGVADFSESLLVALAMIFLIVHPVLGQAYYVASGSMEPTLMGHDRPSDSVHDHIFVNKWVYRYHDPQYGDIVVFRAPKNADQEAQIMGFPQREQIFIKRVIGLPGDTLEVKEVEGSDHQRKRAVFRNGKRLTEPYIREAMETSSIGDNAADQPLKLGSHELFVMGDNRNESSDSRTWGVLDRSRVIGKAFVLFYPFSRMHWIP